MPESWVQPTRWTTLSSWFEYYLDQAVDLYSVAAIVASTDAQYLAKLEMDYIGFAKETTQTMLAHLRTQPVVLNEEK